VIRVRYCLLGTSTAMYIALLARAVTTSNGPGHDLPAPPPVIAHGPAQSCYQPADPDITGIGVRMSLYISFLVTGLSSPVTI
jgi:hypothetical protein